MMGKKIKKRNMRKSESDILRLGRGSSSGSNSTSRSAVSLREISDHEILIEKEALKHVRVTNLKQRELADSDEGSTKVEAQSTKSLDFLEEKKPDVHHASSKSKKISKEMEMEEDMHNGNSKLSMTSKRDSGTSPPPPHVREGRSHSPEMEEPEQEMRPHPKYLNEAFWDPKPGTSVTNQQRYYHTQERLKRLSSPFLQSQTPQNRIRLHLNTNTRQRRPGGPKEGTTAQRVASAKRMTIMDLKSKIQLLQDEIEKLKKENRFLNHLHHRQDNALKKWEGKDAELPKLLNQHKDEIRALNQQLRKAQQTTRESTEKLAMRDKKIFRLEAELDKLRLLAQEEHLQDRHQLQEDLNITRMNLGGAEKRIREYMKHVDILEKNHRHQLTTQERKMIKVNNNTYELQQVVANLRLALRNKDRMLNYIQMRSSGRNLIRAFHAEKVGIEDMLYGTGIVTTINRPYPPLEQPQLLKPQIAESVSTIKSECCGLRDARDFDGASQFSHKAGSVNANIQRNANAIVNYKTPQRQMEDGEFSKRPLSKHSRSLDSIVRAPTLTPRSMNDKKSESASLANFPKPVQQPRTLNMGAQQRQMKQRNGICAKKLNKAISSNRNAGEIVVNKNHHPQDQSRNEDVSSKPPKAPTPTQQRNPSSVGQQSRQNSKSVDNNEGDKKSSRIPVTNNYNQTLKDNQRKIKINKSRELVYRASTAGFKYEGPFVKNGNGPEGEGEELLEQQSAEILYSVKSDQLSERGSSASSSASSSAYSDHSKTASSHRSELLSNIDILSARIRESCVLVSPPEDKLKSPRNVKEKKYTRQESQSVTSNLYFDDDVGSPKKRKPQVGPSGDGSAPTSTLNAFMHQGTPILTMSQDNYQNLDSSRYQQQPAGILQIISADTVQQAGSPKTTQTYMCTSPREQIQAISLPTVNQYVQVNDPTGSPQLISPRSPRLVQSTQQQQPISNMVSYTSSPSMSSQNYSSFNFEVQQPQPSLFPTDYSYLSYPTTAQDTQQSSNVTLYTPSPSYDPYQPNSAAGYLQPQGSTFFSTPPPISKPNTLPSVGYFNPVSNSGGGESTLPSINNNSSANQPSYNPSYYVNLNSWK